MLTTPAQSALPERCVMLAQAYLAQTALELRAGDRVKVACVKA